MKKDIYNVWNGSGVELTLNKIALITNIEIPDCFLSVADEIIGDITNTVLSDKKPKTVKVCFLYWPNRNSIEKIREYIKTGGVVITNTPVADEDGGAMPVILLPSLNAVHNAWLALGVYLKDMLDLPAIAVTGSVGKTTLTLFLDCIFSDHYNVFTSGGNLNTSEYFVRQMFRNYNSKHNFHIQECGAGYTNCVDLSARVIRPDAFILANILPHHLDKYKTIENVLYDKLGVDRHAKDSAFGVINLDDDMLRSTEYKHRVVTVGIKHKEADYYAENIRSDSKLHLDIVHGDERTHIDVEIPGKHNAYNVLLAFATAKGFGLANEEIVKSLEKYRSGDIRQNIRVVSGRILYVDCFNVCAESIHSGLDTLNDMSPVQNGRRIAVIGGENALGDKAFSANYEVGLGFSKYKNIDEYVFFGPAADADNELQNKLGNASAVYEGAKKAVRNKKLSFFDDGKKLAQYLVENTKPGDIVFFKAIIYLPLFPIIDMAFGTSYSVYNAVYIGSTTVSDGNFTARYYSQLNGCNIIGCKALSVKLHFPNMIADKPLHRIGKSVFENKEKICDIDFGNSVMNIGSRAFYGCNNLKKLNVPCNVVHIESEAFAHCGALKSVKLEGVEHIEAEAFSGCKNLETVELSEFCVTIEKDAFADCNDNLTIIAPKGSYALQYAQENGFRVKW